MKAGWNEITNSYMVFRTSLDQGASRGKAAVRSAGLGITYNDRLFAAFKAGTIDGRSE
jgi:hypothetical protein